MGMPKIVSQGTTQMYVNDATERKTARVEKRSFGAIVGRTADVALRGVEVGATVVGGPLVGAAVRGIRVGVEAATGSGGPGVAGVAGPLSGGAGDPASTIAAGQGEEQNTLDQVKAMQEQAQDFNLQFLALQENVQQENRRFTTVSNVLKAKHETAKAAVQNIRA